MTKIVLFSLVFFLPLVQSSYGETSELTVSLDKSEYIIGETITITGESSKFFENETLLLHFRSPITGFEKQITEPSAVQADGKLHVKIEIGDEDVWHFPGPIEFRAYYGSSWSDGITFFVTGNVVSVSVITDKYAYESGDSIIVTGEVSEIWPNAPFSIEVLDPAGNDVWYDQFDNLVGKDNKFTKAILPNSSWKESGRYTVSVGYGDHHGIAYFEYGTTNHLQDHTSPIIIKPADIQIDSSIDSAVEYSVKAFDDTDGIVDVICEPPSGSIFSVGETRVVCNAADSNGNDAIMSFFITIGDITLNIPDWIKQVAEFWINNEIDDNGFVQVIQYLVEHGVITIPNAETTEEQTTTQIPSWIKTNAGFWVNGQISDEEFATGIEWLINNGIIKV